MAMKLHVLNLLLLLLIFFHPAKAQLNWQQGELTLITGIRLRGDLFYQPQANTLLFRLTNTNTWRTYLADQIRGFYYIQRETGRHHHFWVYAVGLKNREESVSVIFEQLIPGAAVALLQLTAANNRRLIAKQGLPGYPASSWQTDQPWYVWLNGRFLAPDVFVKTELDGLLATAPETVRRWGNEYPRPTTPKALARWLAHFDRVMGDAQPKSIISPTIASGRM